MWCAYMSPPVFCPHQFTTLNSALSSLISIEATAKALLDAPEEPEGSTQAPLASVQPSALQRPVAKAISIGNTSAFKSMRPVN